MFDLSNEAIQAKAQDNEFEKGLEYYRNRRIKSVQYNQERRTFTATVLGSKLHTLHLGFNSDGILSTADCTCSSGSNIYGCCRHMVAVMLLIQEKDAQGFFRELRFRQVAKDIFNFFSDRQISIKSTVRIEPTLELTRANTANREVLPALKLRIGQDRLYVVRDIKRLLAHIENNMELSFGKHFTFTPSQHEFKGRDLKLIELLMEIYQTERLMEVLSSSQRVATVFPDNKVCLTDSTLKHFLEIYGDQPFRAVIFGKEQPLVHVRHEDIPINFLLSNDGQDLILSIDFEGTMLPLTQDGEYFFSGGDIFHISKQQSDYLKPFYMAMMYQRSRKLRFINEDKQRFVSEILPFAEKAGKLIISDQVMTTIERPPLEAEIYLDREGSDISADVRFKYGDHIINPFLPTFNPSGKLLIREISNEEAILDILAMAEFRVKDGKVHLSGEDNIYDFVFRLVPLLQEHALVFYSESLKNMKLRSSLSFSGRFRLNNETDMLEFSFSADGIDDTELADIMASLIKKKKYYQLKNGSFINLESKELGSLGDFLEKLEVDPDMLRHDSIEIPKFRAAYLDQSIRDLGIHNIERNTAFKEFVQNIREPEDMDFPVPPELKGSLRDYQKFGYKWLKTLDHYKLGGILADDMGLGKTLQVITLILSSCKEGKQPSLVVVPTSLVFNWCAELDKFAPSLTYLAVTGTADERRRLIGSISGYDVIITTYPLIRRDIDLYSAYTFKYCILDEAQYIKNPSSQNARAVKQLKAGTRFALTGTPMENNLYELWSIFDFVLPGYLYSYDTFSKKYVLASTDSEGQDILSDLGRQIRPFILRRIKSEVLDELPDKLENTMVAELTEEQKKLYLAFLNDVRSEIKKDIEEVGFERSRIKILAALTRLRQLCCHPSLFVENYKGESGKLQLLEEIIQNSIEGGHRILVFSQFTAMLQIIRDRLTELKIPYLYLDGATPVQERGNLVNSFNEGIGKVFLISLKAGGTGLNLTGADTVIHYDPWWNPAVEEQATDRAYRIGQKNSVYVMKLVAKGTIEEKILALQEKKRQLIDTVIQPGETLLSKMTQEEIRELFE